MAVAAMAQENDDPDLASSLSRAIELRSSFFRGQADSLTLPAVRRLLERDLELKNLHLDAHKSLVKILVDKVLNDAKNDAEDESVVTEKPKQKRKKKSRVVEVLQDGDHETGRINDGNSDNKSKLLKNVDTDQKPTEIGEEESEDHGNLLENLRGAEKPESLGNAAEMPTNGDEELFEKQGDADEGPNNVDKEILEKELDAQENLAESIEEALEKGNVLPEDTQEKPDEVESPKINVGTIDENAIKSALMKRADELKSRAESLTVTTVRHLLEEDLGLEPDGLDVHKQFIRRLVDELLRDANEEPMGDAPNLGKAKKERAPVTGEGKLKKKRDAKSALGKRSVLDDETEESEEKFQGSGEVSDSASEERRPGKVRIRKKKTNEAKTKPMVVKKIVEVKRPFSANVERLREILKAVGLGVSPIVYKKAKQAPEHEREEVLVKELENRLSQEGLSPNPTEKEIRRVKTRLEKKRDLDGIEHSNIVAEPRRSRAAANSWFAPRQNKYSEVGEVGNKDSEEQDSDDDPKPMVTGAMDD